MRTLQPCYGCSKTTGNLSTNLCFNCFCVNWKSSLKYLLAFLVRAEKRKEKSIRNLQREIWPNKFHIYVKNTVLLVCTWRHGGHVGGQEQKHFSPLGTKLYFHVNYSRKYSFALTPNMAALSRGCKPRILLKNHFYPANTAISHVSGNTLVKAIRGEGELYLQAK